jgi:topoisomerase-4 subunit A
MMAVLFAHTSLEDGFSVNCTLLGLDGRPQQKGLRQILAEWAAFRVDTVTRRARHQLERAEARIHILEGRRIVFLNIDRVIKVIREADDPKADLIASFQLTAIQAEDILEIRLRQLARLEGIRIEQELAELLSEQGRLGALLGSDRALRRLIVKEIEADAAKYGDARRTLLEPIARATTVRTAIFVPDEPVTIIISKNGWIRARPGHEVDVSTLTYKAGDSLGAVVQTRTTRPVAILDSKGRAYAIDAADVPSGRGDGVPITSLVDLQDGAKARCMLSAAPDTRYLFANSGGYGYIAPFASLVGRNRAGKAFMTLEEGEGVLSPVPLDGPGDDLFEPSGFVACVATNGKLLCFPLAEAKLLDRGRGVILMQLDRGEKLAWTGLYRDELTVPVIVRGKTQRLTLKGEELARHLLHRARKGTLLPKKALPAGG